MIERSFKVILLGDYAVGKTSLLNRFLRGEFQPEYIPTIGTEISEKEFRFSSCIIRLMLWDLGGEKEFSEVREEYCANAQAAIIVYDICRPASFKSVEEWYMGMSELANSEPKPFFLVKRNVKVAAGSAADVPIVWLVGNKLDLKENRVVDRSVAEEKAKKLGSNYMEVSAKTGENVDALFTSILRSLIELRLSTIKKELEDLGHD